MQQPITGNYAIKPTRELKVGDLVHDFYDSEEAAQAHLAKLEDGSIKPTLNRATEQDIEDDSFEWPFAIAVVEAP